MDQNPSVIGPDQTKIQVLEGLTLAEAQEQASNIRNLDDPYEEDVRKVVFGDNYKSLLPTTSTNIVSSDGLRTNLEVSLERGKEIMEKATAPTVGQAAPGESFYKGVNGKFYSMDDIVNVLAISEAQAANDPNFAVFRNAVKQDPPPTEKEAFTTWLWEHKIYVAAGVAAIFFGWWIYQNFCKDGGAEADMVDAAAAFCTGF